MKDVKRDNAQSRGLGVRRHVSCLNTVLRLGSLMSTRLGKDDACRNRCFR